MRCDVAGVPLGGSVDNRANPHQVSFNLFHLQSLLSSEDICKENKNVFYFLKNKLIYLFLLPSIELEESDVSNSIL